MARETKFNAKQLLVGELYKRLRLEGKSQAQAAEMANKESGTTYSPKSLSAFASQCPKPHVAAGQESTPEEPTEPTSMTPPAPEAERKDGNEQKAEEPVEEPQDRDEHIKRVAREVFQEMFQNVLNDRNVIEDFQELVPEAQTIKGEGKGRRQDRVYAKVSVTVDAALWDLFLQEQRCNKIPSARLLDSILWRHFGKPALSFELPEDEQEVLRRKYGRGPKRGQG